MFAIAHVRAQFDWVTRLYSVDVVVGTCLTRVVSTCPVCVEVAVLVIRRSARTRGNVLCSLGVDELEKCRAHVCAERTLRIQTDNIYIACHEKRQGGMRVFRAMTLLTLSFLFSFHVSTIWSLHSLDTNRMRQNRGRSTAGRLSLIRRPPSLSRRGPL